jgi:HEAT repeat protein
MGILDKLFGPPDIDKLVRQWVAGDSAGLTGLIRALQHKDSTARLKAVTALVEEGKSIVDAGRSFQEEAGDLGSIVHINALALTSDRRIVEALIERLKDENVAVRSTAAVGLGRARAASVAAVLFDALIVSTDPIMASIRDEHRKRDQALKAARTVGLSSHSKFEFVSQEALTYDGTSFMRTARERIVQYWGKEAREALVPVLSDMDPSVREAAEGALESIGGLEAERALSECRGPKPSGAESSV